jgi:FkbM family methyltransferase
MTELENELLEIFSKQEQNFGRGVFYQSLPSVGISGQRPTDERIKTYGLRNIIGSNTSVLDVGCNCGFFSLHLAQYVKEIDAIEPNASLAEIANHAKKYLSIDNCEFYNTTYSEFAGEKKYDLILSFAVHHWVGVSIFEYAKSLSEILNVNGLVVMESHALRTIDRWFGGKVAVFELLGFKVINSGEVNDDPSMNRKFVILKKQVDLPEVSEKDTYKAKACGYIADKIGKLYIYLAKLRIV